MDNNKKKKSKNFDAYEDSDDDVFSPDAKNDYGKGKKQAPGKQVQTALTTNLKPSAKNTQQLKKNLLDDSDEDDERGLNNNYLLNKINDSFDKKSAYTDFKRSNNKESQDTFQNPNIKKPPLSDVSQGSSNKGFKKTQKRYEENDYEDDSEEDRHQFLKPSANSKQPVKSTQGKVNPPSKQASSNAKNTFGRPQESDEESDEEVEFNALAKNNKKGGNNNNNKNQNMKKVAKKFSDEEDEEEDDDEKKKPLIKNKLQPPLPQNKKQQSKKQDSESDEDEDDKSSKQFRGQTSKSNRKERELESVEDRKQAEINKKKQKNFVKKENEFDFNEEINEKSQYPMHIAEYGVPLNELEDIHAYYSLPSKAIKKEQKNRRKLAKHLRNKNYFYTSKCFMLFHFLQTAMFWIVATAFPFYAVIGCNGGHSWTSHIAILTYLGLNLIFDLVFAAQYYEKESIKYELQYNQEVNNEAKLKALKKRKSYRRKHMDSDEELHSMQAAFKSRGSHMLGVFIQILFELTMTYIGLLRIYCDYAFLSIVSKERLNMYAYASGISLIFLGLPKLYAMIMSLVIMFGGVKEENKLRKHAFRILIFNEFRVQALNVEYVQHQKNKIDLLQGFMKFIFQDFPQVCIQISYLLETDCGKKNPNSIIIIGIILALINTYFGFLYRLMNVCYSVNRLNSIKRRVQIVINNILLATFGFSNLRGKIHGNKKIESLVFSGENYEYFFLNERSVVKFSKLMEQFPSKETVFFVEAKRVKFKSVREAKLLFVAIDANYPKMRYLTLQECSLCHNFILQLKTFIDGNTSMTRISLVQNQMSEKDCYEAIETSIDHPNIEIIQLAETQIEQKKTKKDKKNPQESTDFSVVCRGIQQKFVANKTLRVIEIRYLALDKSFVNAIFQGIENNGILQVLTLTHNALIKAEQHEFDNFASALQENQSLLSFDFTYNENLDDNLIYHKNMSDAILENRDSRLVKVHLTSKSLDVKSHYLDVIDIKQDLSVYMNEKILEDVDVQDSN